MLSRRNVILGSGAAVLAGALGYQYGSGKAYDVAVRDVWLRRTEKNYSEFEYLVYHATLAANSHNTQPWLFSGSDKTMTIKPDFKRATPAADADNHHLYASLGCASENLIAAASSLSKSAAMDFFDDDSGGEIKFDFANGALEQDPNFDAILERQCTRSIYDGNKVSNADLITLERAAAFNGCDIIFIEEHKKIEQIIELVVAANTLQIENQKFVDELKSWLRFSGLEASQRRDGLYSKCSGNPSIPTWLGNMVFKSAFTPSIENEKYVKQIRSSSGIAIFVSHRNDKNHWINAGRCYQRFALRSTALGIKHAFINQPVEVDVMLSQLANMLSLGDHRPDFVIRYGYAPKMPKSLRRRVNDVIMQS